MCFSKPHDSNYSKETGPRRQQHICLKQSEINASNQYKNVYLFYFFLEKVQKLQRATECGLLAEVWFGSAEIHFKATDKY